MTKEKEQWIRYRREVNYLLKCFKNYEIKNDEFSAGFVSDYFSDETIKEMKERESFEGIE